MNIIVNDILYSIDKIYAEYSPYLSTLVNTKISVDMNKEGHYILNMDLETEISMIEYVAFLKGESFEMDEDIAILFDMMGHSNHMDYPLDYWRVKLRDNWIRDNMYRLDLWKDPYYGLQKIDDRYSLYP